MTKKVKKELTDSEQLLKMANISLTVSITGLAITLTAFIAVLIMAFCK